MKKLIAMAGLSLVGISALTAQETEENKPTLTLSTYVDGYFAGYDNDLGQEEFQPFITTGPRDNNFGINVAQIGLQYEAEKVRSNFVLHYGDIPQATWSGDFNMVQQANVGFLITDGLWLDAGLFTTHIGTESFLPKNNMLSSTAFITYNEPFYQAGAKLSYNNVENWYFELWALNGYNNFVDNNDAKSVGALISHNFSENTSITYTNIYGRESEDGVLPKQDRFYQNIYLNQNWNDKLFLTLGFDYGLQSDSDLAEPNKSASMYGGLVTARYQFTPKWSVTGRAEIFKDENGFISGTAENSNGEITGIELTGYTLGTEFKPLENAYIRAEARYTDAGNDLEIFVKNGEATNNRLELLITMGLSLDKVFNF